MISSFLFLTNDIHSSTTSKINLNGASMIKSKIKIKKLSLAISELKNLPNASKGIKKKSTTGERILGFFIFIFDFIKEAPFKLIFEVVEEWISFVRKRKEEII